MVHGITSPSAAPQLSSAVEAPTSPPANIRAYQSLFTRTATYLSRCAPFCCLITHKSHQEPCGELGVSLALCGCPRCPEQVTSNSRPVGPVPAAGKGHWL